MAVNQFAGVADWLDELLADDTVSDILICGSHKVCIEKNGTLTTWEKNCIVEDKWGDFLDCLLVPVRRQLDSRAPYLDGRLLDGSRFHVILPPLVNPGPHVSIRKHRTAKGAAPLTLDDFGPGTMVSVVANHFKNGANLLVSGATGAGKTTFLRLLLETLDVSTRCLIIEENRELMPFLPNVVSLEARPPSPDNVGEVTLRTLLKNALRMRPDRIVLGECRGAEATDLIQALSVGHRGSAGTIHSGSALGALRRLEALSLLGTSTLNVETIRYWVASAVQLVVHLGRAENQRFVAEVVEICGLEGGAYRIRPLFQGIKAGLES